MRVSGPEISRRDWLRGAGAFGAGAFGAGAFGATLAGGSPFAMAQPAAAKGLVIDCHGHYTTEPKEFLAFRQAQIAALKDPPQKPSVASLKISDDQLRESVQP